jgi:nicotinamide-nucleotide amidase
MLIAEIIGVGDELLYGETVDTNTSEIAVSLKPYAVEIRRTLRVADNLETLAQEVRQAWQSARLVVISGGLGPTPDDITREAIAVALEEELELDQEVLEWLEKLFEARGWKMPEVNRKQALKIPSARWIANPRALRPAGGCTKRIKT